MVVLDIANILNQFAPLELQEKYDNSGLQIGTPQQEVTGVLITIDVTESVIDEAKSLGLNVIVAHHPLIFDGVKSLTGKTFVERCILKAISLNIAIIVGHTNFDSVLGGVSYMMGKRLNLVNTRVLVPRSDALFKLVTFVPKSHIAVVQEAVFLAGGGQIGKYSNCGFNIIGEGTFLASDECHPFVGVANIAHIEQEVRFETIFPFFKKGEILKALKSSHPYEEVAFDVYKLENTWNEVGYGIVGDLVAPMTGAEFLSFLKLSFCLNSIRYTEMPTTPILSVAVVGGSGSSFFKDAINAKADVFVSGDFKYHQFFDANERIAIADIGHYESEQFTKDLFFEILTKKITTFAICKSSINTNPIKYL